MLEAVARNAKDTAPFFSAYHLLLIDHVLVTLITDEKRNVIECRFDVVAEVSPEIGHQICVDALGSYANGNATFSSTGFDARDGMDNAVTFLEGMAEKVALKVADHLIDPEPVNSVRSVKGGNQAG